jgi:hypothetical protein
MATAALTNGTKARNDANTNASTASAPTAPNMASTTTPLPLPPDVVLRGASRPVTCTCAPASGTAPAACRTAATWLVVSCVLPP